MVDEEDESVRRRRDGIATDILASGFGRKAEVLLCLSAVAEVVMGAFMGGELVADVGSVVGDLRRCRLGLGFAEKESKEEENLEAVVIEAI